MTEQERTDRVLMLIVRLLAVQIIKNDITLSHDEKKFIAEWHDEQRKNFEYDLTNFSDHGQT